MKKSPHATLKLEQKKLLGFRIQTTVSQASGAESILKIGAKAGNKSGGKAGVKVGSKPTVCFTIGAKSGSKSN